MATGTLYKTDYHTLPYEWNDRQCTTGITLIKHFPSCIYLFYGLVIHLKVPLFAPVIGLQVRWFLYVLLSVKLIYFFFKGKMKNQKKAVSKFGSFSATLENGIQLSLSYYGPTGKTAGKVSK